jgi:hypothetical protein
VSRADLGRIRRWAVSSADNQFPKPSFLSSRILSALELLLGAFIVIGHNVFHVVPNEVPILFVLGLVSIRLRNGGWSVMGLKRPASWVRIVLIALAAAALRIILGDLVIEPLAGHFWPPIIAPAGAEAITGNIKSALVWLLGLDLGRVRRRGRVSRIPAHPCGRHRRKDDGGLLDWNRCRLSSVWLRALLQRSSRYPGFGSCRAGSGSGLHVIRPEFMG